MTKQGVAGFCKIHMLPSVSTIRVLAGSDDNKIKRDSIMAYATEIHALHGDITHRIAAAYKSATTRFASYRVYRKTIAELSVLSTRELDDLGLSRSMIKRTAFEAAYGH